MKDAIGYLRVSTREQGRSGLSFAAQRFDIEHFGKREGFSIASWYQDSQTGAGSDPLSLRLGLASALKEARIARCPLIVSRLDRLSRNVHFIAGLMEHKVHFMVAAFGRDVDPFTLHIYASIVQQERKMIGERVRAAAQIAKRRGRKFGLQLRSKSWQRRVSALGRAALRREALVRAQAYRVYVEWALGQLGPNGRPISFRAAAIKLNERHIDTPLGGRWRGHQVQRMARRLGLDHPVAYLTDKLARARVRALWQARPDIMGTEVVALVSQTTPRRFDIRRAWALLQEFRRDAARRSRVHTKAGWTLDRRTTTRIRIGEMWKRRPQLTARQMIHELRPAVPSFVRVKWVQKIMHDCGCAFAAAGPERSRVGRRTLNPRRHPTDFSKSSSPVRIGKRRARPLPHGLATMAAPHPLARLSRKTSR